MKSDSKKEDLLFLSEEGCVAIYIPEAG